MTDVKFCGLTRAEDAAFGAELGARYLGVVLAGGPRMLTPEKAREVVQERGSARAVGVFATRDASLIARTADAAGLDVIQLHGDPDPGIVSAVKLVTGRPVWAVVRVSGGELPASIAELFKVADGVLLDTKSEGRHGGTGTPFDWSAAAERLERISRDAPFILAGGLTDRNVAAAVTVLAPDVVDVSSGVEAAPGIKDHECMRRFVTAARGAGSVAR